MDYSQIPLRPIALPDAIGWWPPAFGWWLLVILVLVMLVWGIKKLLRQGEREAARKSALSELSQIKHQFETYGDQAWLLGECSALLRRTALSYFPRQQVASLSGNVWLEFLLDNSAGCKKSQLECLVNGPYQRVSEVNANELINVCQQWIKTVRVGVNNV